jgi:hypothetical protein
MSLPDAMLQRLVTKGIQRPNPDNTASFLPASKIPRRPVAMAMHLSKFRASGEPELDWSEDSLVSAAGPTFSAQPWIPVAAADSAMFFVNFL